MFCYSLLECPNKVCVCVGGWGSCGWTCMCMLCGEQRTPWVLCGPLCILRYDLSLLKIGSLRPPLCLLHQDCKHTPPCIAEMFLTRVLEVVLARQVLYQQSHLLSLRQYFNSYLLGNIYYTYLKIRIWRTVRNISLVSNPDTCFSGFCLFEASGQCLHIPPFSSTPFLRYIFSFSTSSLSLSLS